MDKGKSAIIKVSKLQPKAVLQKILSLQHPIVKHLVNLREDRDYRYKTNSVVVSGLKLIEELSSHQHFQKLFVEEGFLPSFPYRTDELFEVSPQILKKVTGLKNPEPIAAEITMPSTQDLTSANFLLILDGISDPGNLGTLLRTALALGWEGAFITCGSTDPFNEKAIRSAKGATFKLPLRSGTWEELKNLLQKKQFTLFAADAKGQDIKDCKTSGLPIALALGNEAHGISSELKKNAKMLAIPMHGPMESLNVASAGAILMYELKDQIA
jgi:TrmH family RNA methyltransferase